MTASHHRWWVGAVVLGLAGLGGVAAQVPDQEKAGHLRLGQSPQAQPTVDVFPADVRSAFARFDYRDASNDRIAVVASWRGMDLYRGERRYTGGGSDAMEIAGTAIYQRLTLVLADAAQQGRADARLAAIQPHGTNDYLLSVQASLFRASTALELLGRTRPGRDDSLRIVAARRAVGDAATLIGRAVDLPEDEPEEKRALAEQADAPLGRLVTVATELKGTAAAKANLAIPGTGVSEHASYVVQLEVNDNPVASTEFWVARPARIYLPTASKNVPLRVR
jgi:hypothetical protein